MTKKVVLVTGGTGLVGNGIRIAHERDPRDDETFVFLSSKDADLTDKESTRKVNKGKPNIENHFGKILCSLNRFSFFVYFIRAACFIFFGTSSIRISSLLPMKPAHHFLLTFLR